MAWQRNIKRIRRVMASAWQSAEKRVGENGVYVALSVIWRVMAQWHQRISNHGGGGMAYNNSVMAAISMAKVIIWRRRIMA